jgi:hypothetical protein
MRQDLLLVAVILIIVVIGGGLLVATGSIPGSGQTVSVTSFKTDKDIYHSKETMKFQISLASGASLDNVTVHLEGITDRYGSTRLNKDIPVSIAPGTNTVTYEYQLPTCSKCSGLDPGIYPINLTVFKSGKPIAIGNQTVHLEQ